MLWVPLPRKVRVFYSIIELLHLSCFLQTRSGADFSAFSLPTDAILPLRVAVLQERDFDFAPLIVHAVMSEGEDQEDHEDDDAPLDAMDDDIDIDWPPLPSAEAPLDPLLDIDEDWPPPPPPDTWNDIDDVDEPSKARHRPRSASLDKVICSSKKPHTGPHRRRPARLTKVERAQKRSSTSHNRRAARRARDFATKGHVPAPSTIEAHVKRAAPLATGLDASTLPAALGAYGAKSEDNKERRGSKVCRSLSSLLGIGFQLIQWDGL
jgi:hypothetical protein